MFKDSYNRINSQITPDERLVLATIENAQKEEKNLKKPIYRFRKNLLTAAIILCLCVLLAFTPAMALTNETIYQMMYCVSPSVAQFFVPVQKSCTYKNLELKLVSTYIHDDTAEFYVELHDIKGDIIDETVTLGYYSINTAADSSGNCQRVGYDDKTKTATFIVKINQWHDEKITVDKLTFTVKSVITGYEKNLGYKVAIDLSEVSQSPTTKKEYVYFENHDIQAEVLVPQKKYSEADFGRHYISAVGYINGCLHIQTATDFSADNLGHSYLYLRNKADITPINLNRDSEGNINNYEIYYAWKDGNINYDEYVINLTPEGEEFNVNRYADYELYGDFYTSNDAIEGLWKISFPMENSTEKAPYSSDESSENPTEPFVPQTKEDYYSMLLCPTNYCSTLSGSFEQTLYGFENKITTEYAVDLDNQNCYEHSQRTSDGSVYSDTEIYVINGVINEFNNTDKTTSRQIRLLDKSYNNTGLNDACCSIDSEQQINYLLSNFDLWKITGEGDYLGRSCAIIDGKVADEYTDFYGNSFRLTVDKRTGVMLDLECYNSENKLIKYLHTTKFDSDNVVIPNFYQSDYEDYTFYY